MKTLHKLSAYSSFAPSTGEVSELYEMVQSGLSRSEAMKLFQAEGRTADHFRHVYKSLKDELLRKSFDETRLELSSLKKRRMDCWAKFHRVKQLHIIEERTAAVELAAEVLKLAERYGFVEIEHSLLINLEYFYGSVQPDTRRYLRYRKRLRDAANAMNEEREAMSLMSLLHFKYRRKKDWAGLADQIAALADSSNKRLTFNLYRFSLLSLWYQLNQDYQKIVETCQTALTFFEQFQNDIPYVIKWNFYRRMIPVLVAQGNFQEADHYLTHCISLPVVGTQNWHMAMLQRAYLGFYSDKPHIAFDAWNRASKNKKHNNPELDELWWTVRAYLGVYEKLGRITVDKPFRLRIYLNSVAHTEQEKHGFNISIIIVHLLHLLLDGKKKEYMQRVEGLPAYIHQHLRGAENLRSRCILYMLIKVEKGDYYRLRTLPRADRWVRQLKKSPRNMVADNEIMPYEKIWEVVLEKLK